MVQQKPLTSRNKNPWTKVPGGSSGGSAARCFGSEVPASLILRSGSIRQPASFTGIVGMKPTYGRISLRIFSLRCLDQIRSFTRAVQDNALVLSAILGCDHDSTSKAQEAPAYHKGLTGDIKGMYRVTKRIFCRRCDAGSSSCIKRADQYREMGAIVG